MVGGVSSVAQGGKFGQGFLSGAFGEIAAPFASDNLFKNIVQGAVVGGVGSVLGGGKFKNGALTASFGRAFNHFKHIGCETGCHPAVDPDQAERDARGRSLANGLVGSLLTGLETLVSAVTRFPVKFGGIFAGSRVANKPLLGKNPKIKKDRTLTDLDPAHDRATAKSIFRNQTKGQNIRQFENKRGDIIRRADDGTQIRMNPDGSTRLDLPGRGTQPNGETIHFNP